MKTKPKILRAEVAPPKPPPVPVVPPPPPPVPVKLADPEVPIPRRQPRNRLGAIGGGLALLLFTAQIHAQPIGGGGVTKQVVTNIVLAIGVNPTNGTSPAVVSNIVQMVGLPATNLFGTVPNSVDLGTNVPLKDANNVWGAGKTNTFHTIQANGNVTVDGVIGGNGSDITAISADHITTGTLQRPLSWTNLVNVPAGFADGTDDGGGGIGGTNVTLYGLTTNQSALYLGFGGFDGQLNINNSGGNNAAIGFDGANITLSYPLGTGTVPYTALTATSGTGPDVLLSLSPTITTPSILGAVNWPSGTRQTFAPGGTTPGFNFGSVAGDPASATDGDAWYNTSLSQARYKEGGTVKSFASGAGNVNASSFGASNLVTRSSGTGTDIQGSPVKLSNSGALSEVDYLSSTNGVFDQLGTNRFKITSTYTAMIDEAGKTNNLSSSTGGTNVMRSPNGTAYVQVKDDGTILLTGTIAQLVASLLNITDMNVTNAYFLLTNKLLAARSDGKLHAVTIGAGLTFDGTNLVGTAAGNTNWVLAGNALQGYYPGTTSVGITMDADNHQLTLSSLGSTYQIAVDEEDGITMVGGFNTTSASLGTVTATTIAGNGAGISNVVSSVFTNRTIGIGSAADTNAVAISTKGLIITNAVGGLLLNSGIGSQPLMSIGQADAPAGEFASAAGYSVFAGNGAGAYATNATQSQFIGFQAGQYAFGADHSTFSGQYSGQHANSSTYALMLGNGSGRYATNSDLAVILGTDAGSWAYGSTYSVMVGASAGEFASAAPYSVLLGDSSGRYATNAEFSVFIGYLAGQNVNRANTLIITGSDSGTNALIYGEFDNRFLRFNASVEVTNNFQVKGTMYWPTNAGSDVTIDYTKAYSFLSTNNNLSITGRTGYSATNFNQKILTITNTSGAAISVTMAGTFKNMNASEGNTLYCTNLGQLLVFEMVGTGTNFYWKSR